MHSTCRPYAYELPCWRDQHNGGLTGGVVLAEGAAAGTELYVAARDGGMLLSSAKQTAGSHSEHLPLLSAATFDNC